MRTLRYSLRIMLFIAILTVKIIASGKFTILLVDFNNPKHTLYNGGCCDNINWCISQCDNFFRFCASTVGSIKECSLGGWLSTAVVGDDSFTFPKDLGGGLKNPISYSFEEWKGVSVAVEVWDDDGGQLIGKLDDFVDKYTLVVTQKPKKNKKASSPLSKQLCGEASCTNVKVEVYCDDNYLIPKCTEYCVSRDNDIEGHYTCNYDRGLKICLKGWYDAANNCTKEKKECTPRNDTTGHYDCNPESGEKICLSGWKGTNCTEVYALSSLKPTTTAHHIQTTHFHRSTEWKPTTTASTVGWFSIPITSTLYIQPSSTTNELKTMSTMTMQSSYFSKDPVHTTGPITEHSLSRIIHTSNTPVKSTTSSIQQKNSTTLSKDILETPVSTKHGTVTKSIETSLILTKSSVTPIYIGPTTGFDHVVVIHISPKRNWTKEKEDKIKIIIKDQLNKMCMKYPQSCYINTKSTLNSASLFNETDVSLDIGSTGDDLHVSVKVKIPEGGLVPLIVIKDAIKGSKKAIEKQTGLKVSLDNKSIALMSTTTTRPPTTFPPGVIISTPTRSIIPGLHDYWAVIVCAVAATLFLLAITLCFTFHANRQTKVHPLKVPRTKSTIVGKGSSTIDPEMISLTRVHRVTTNKTTDKKESQDTNVRSRSSSLNCKENRRFPDSPFTPDYIDF